MGELGQVKVDGKVIVDAGRSLESQTCDASEFAVDLAGKRAMGLTAGPTSATSEDLCRQACCDAGDSCEIYQFSEHPSKGPDCLSIIFLPSVSTLFSHSSGAVCVCADQRHS